MMSATGSSERAIVPPSRRGADVSTCIVKGRLGSPTELLGIER
jgi:hypothetical protein